jgi:hypothetical protein
VRWLLVTFILLLLIGFAAIYFLAPGPLRSTGP